MASKYGIKVSRDGFDAEKCADHELLFSSGFPTLMVHKVGRVTGSGTAGQTLVTHDLGYYPVFLFLSEDENGSGKMSLHTGQNIGITTAVLKVWPTSGWSGVGYYVIFRRKLQEEFTAPIVNSLGQQQGGASTNSYGFKIPKEGADINSTDYRDFHIHSSTRNMLVHMSGTITKTGNTGPNDFRVITHNLGYKPMYFIFNKPSSGNDDLTYKQMLVLPNTGASHMPVTATETTVEFQANQDGEYAYIILKDPIL